MTVLKPTTCSLCGILLFGLVGLPFREALAAEPSQSPPGRPLLDDFLRRQVGEISGHCLAGIDGRERWLEEREKLRSEIREMLGLLPEPPRGDLRATVTGTGVREDLGIAVEKLHFQSVPGLYVTANLYRPLSLEGKAPAILYLCGHGQVKLEGISCGNKALYQHHPTWFARNGYLCLIVDTLQLGEIEGKHHGTYRLEQWWWVSRGYTPAGVEAWNSIRALDYLESRPEVDPKRIGVTGRSGGGIGTWWLAALDDRPAVFVPVAGVTDLENHVLTGCIDGHCDCNYPVNLYRWDFPALAALAAPRPLLFSNTDKDSIFPLDGVQRVHGKLKRIYELYGASSHLGLCIVEGPHADTQELQVPAFRWMDRWLRGKSNNPVGMLAEKLIDPKDLRVFQNGPADERNTSIEETFVAAAPPPEVPADRAGFDGLRVRLLEQLRAKVFRTAPDPGGPLDVEAVVTAERDGLRLGGFRFLSEEPFRLTLWVISVAGPSRPQAVVLRVADEDCWKDWTKAAAATFAAELGVEPKSADPEGAKDLRAHLQSDQIALAVLAPRGIGPTRWSDDPKLETQLRRRLLVVGRLVAETRIFDVRRAVRALEAVRGPDAAKPLPAAGDLAGAPIRLEARGEMAGIALYAAIFEPSVASLHLDALPRSHRDGVTLMNVLRVLDMPQAVSLVFPREVRLRGVAPDDFGWARKAAALFASASSPGGPLRLPEVRVSAAGTASETPIASGSSEAPITSGAPGCSASSEVPTYSADPDVPTHLASAVAPTRPGLSDAPTRPALAGAATGTTASPIPARSASSGLPASSTSASSLSVSAEAPKRPNVILVITDDQGYGDVGIHGNPVIRTPNMDRIATEGVRLERFYVYPVCAPTRAGLLTGRYSYRTGVLDTYIGRALMYPDEVTLAEILSSAGYRTGIFGKWHLGDCYPMRPIDQGFGEALVHRGGGIGQPSDPPGGTSYFDPVLFHNGKPERQIGYVSDVITDAALDFIDASRDRPFFVYLAFNCPHTPLEVPESYHAMYRDRDLVPDRFPRAGHPVPRMDERLRDTTARIYGMVTNIDDNLGRLLRKLERLGITRDTLLIFLTDNGPQQPRFNAGMLDRKGSVHDGGIRVPCFWRWPGTLPAGKIVDRVAAHIDVVPTLLEALSIPSPAGRKLDGRSFWPLLTGAGGDWPDRCLFFQWHRGDTVELYRAFAARTHRYKLVQPFGAGEGTPRRDFVFKLYDMEKDPLEERDVAAEHPEVVAEMKHAYEAWYREIAAERGFAPPRIVIDGVHEDPLTLTRQDWRGPGAGWAAGNLGHWEVEVAGSQAAYDVALTFAKLEAPGKALLEIGELKLSRDVAAGATGSTFESVALPPGPERLQAWIEDARGSFGVHQVEVRRRP